MALLHAFDRSRLFVHVGGGPDDTMQLVGIIAPPMPGIIGHCVNVAAPREHVLGAMGDCAIAAEKNSNVAARTTAVKRFLTQVNPAGRDFS